MSYRNILQENNTKIRQAIDKTKNLSDTDASVEDLSAEIESQAQLIALQTSKINELITELNGKAAGGGEVVKENATVTLTFGGFSPTKLDKLHWKYYDGETLKDGMHEPHGSSEPYTFQAAVGEVFFVSTYTAWDAHYETGSGIEVYLKESETMHLVCKVVSTENATVYFYDRD